MTAAVCETTDTHVVEAFQRAAARVPAYRQVLAEHGVDAAAVVDSASFAAHAPLLTKANTFDRFSVDELSVGGQLPPLADVLTSSGHGGRFSFGVTSRAQTARNVEMLDAAHDAAFRIKSRSTLAVNCLPMGVVFSSNWMTMATTSVREDMATALVQAFGHRYDQILLVGDPLFLKRLMDSSREQGLDWSRYRVNVVLGEETFGEHFRGYLAACLGHSPERPDHGYIMSSFGVGELGLHLLYETPAVISLRRALFEQPAFARDLLGSRTASSMALPMIFTFSPERTFIEVHEPDGDGFGRMTTSMLDPALAIPLLRYQTGDIVRRLDPAAVLACARRHAVELPLPLPGHLLAVRGRDREALPNGSHVAIYKDALYADREVADRVSGAVRLVCDESGCTMHVQLAAAGRHAAGLAERLERVIPDASRPERIVCWPRDRFPFGMQLDYERKFTHFVPGAHNPSEF